MPALSDADVARLRNADHAADLFLYVIRPPTAATATVSGAHDAASTIINVTGWNNTKAVESHYLVEIDGHRALFQAYNPDTQELSLSRNDLPALAGGEPVVIKEYVPPAVLLPRVEEDGTIYEDNSKAYSDENTSMQPPGRVGPSIVVAFVGADGGATVRWHSDSLPPLTGGTLTGHAWTFEGGNPASSSQAGTAESPIEVEYDTPGLYLTKYTVTASTGKTHTRYVWTVILDETTNPPYSQSDFELSGLQGDFDSGFWDFNVKVRGDADVTEFPDLALVALFAKDYFDGEEVSIGGRWQHRENLVAIGYVVAGSTVRDDELSAVGFECKGIAGIAKDLLTWPANLQSEGDAGWHTIPAMTFGKAAFHILTEHTTFDHIADINFPLYSRTLYSVDLPESDPYDVLDNQLFGANGVRFLSSREGMIYFRHDPQLLAEGFRPTTVVMEVTDDDWVGELDLGDEQFTHRVSQVDLIAFGGTVDLTEYGSLAPPGQHPTGRVEKVTGIRADSQDEANILAGLYEGLLNNEFRDIEADLRGNYRVFDIVPDEIVKLTTSADGNNRGLDWDEVTCYVREVAIKYDYEGEGFEVRVGLEKDVEGEPGEPNPLDPEPPEPPEPPPSPPPPPPPPPAPPTDNWTGLGYLLMRDTASADTDGVYKLIPGETEWQLMWAHQGCNQLILDPWAVAGKGHQTLDILYVAADDAIYRSLDGAETFTKVDIQNPPDSWGDGDSPEYGTGLLKWISIHGDPCHDGVFYAACYYEHFTGSEYVPRAYLYRTKDDFETATVESVLNKYEPVGLGVGQLGAVIHAMKPVICQDIDLWNEAYALQDEMGRLDAIDDTGPAWRLKVGQLGGNSEVLSCLVVHFGMTVPPAITGSMKLNVRGRCYDAPEEQVGSWQPAFNFKWVSAVQGNDGWHTLLNMMAQHDVVQWHTAEHDVPAAWTQGIRYDPNDKDWNVWANGACDDEPNYGGVPGGTDFIVIAWETQWMNPETTMLIDAIWLATDPGMSWPFGIDVDTTTGEGAFLTILTKAFPADTWKLAVATWRYEDDVIMPANVVFDTGETTLGSGGVPVRTFWPHVPHGQSNVMYLYDCAKNAEDGFRLLKYSWVSTEWGIMLLSGTEVAPEQEAAIEDSEPVYHVDAATLDPTDLLCWQGEKLYQSESEGVDWETEADAPLLQTNPDATWRYPDNPDQILAGSGNPGAESAKCHYAPAGVDSFAAMSDGLPSQGEVKSVVFDWIGRLT